jgi:hypothetical protein
MSVRHTAAETSASLGRRVARGMALALLVMPGCVLFNDYDFSGYELSVGDAETPSEAERDGSREAQREADAKPEPDPVHDAGLFRAPPSADGGEDHAPPCAPKTCTALGAQCGSVSDGCGGLLDCGVCKTGQVCGGTQPNHCSRKPNS